MEKVQLHLLDSEYYEIIMALSLIIKDSKAGETVKQSAKDMKRTLYTVEKKYNSGAYFYCDADVGKYDAAELIGLLSYAMKIMEDKN